MAGNVPSCKHNAGVGCQTKGPCENCGWNPEVEPRRKRQNRERLTMGEECAACVYYRVSRFKKKGSG